MKRPLLVLVLAMGILGSLASYSHFLAKLPPLLAQGTELLAATGKFNIEISLSCDLAADPFELDQATSLLVRLAGQDLVHRKEPVATNQPLILENITGVTVGKNAFFVRAIPVPNSIDHANCLRIRIFRNDLLLAENSLWSVAGESIGGEIVVTVPASVDPASVEIATGGKP